MKDIEKVEEKVIEPDVKIIKVRMLGNFKEYLYNEVYELEEEQALPLIVLGYAVIYKM